MLAATLQRVEQRRPQWLIAVPRREYHYFLHLQILPDFHRGKLYLGLYKTTVAHQARFQPDAASKQATAVHVIRLRQFHLTPELGKTWFNSPPSLENHASLLTPSAISSNIGHFPDKNASKASSPLHSECSKTMSINARDLIHIKISTPPSD